MSSVWLNPSVAGGASMAGASASALDRVTKQPAAKPAVETDPSSSSYWSISTTMRSDNMAISAVSDALGLGVAHVGVVAEERVGVAEHGVAQGAEAGQEPRLDVVLVGVDVADLAAVAVLVHRVARDLHRAAADAEQSREQAGAKADG